MTKKEDNVISATFPMQSKLTFHNLIILWLQNQGIAPPSHTPQEVYSLAFGNDQKIHFWLNHEPVRIVAFSEAGTLRHRQAPDVLTALLALNHINTFDIRPSVGLDSLTGKVFVWAHIPLTDCSLQVLTNFTRQIQTRIGEVQDCLTGASRKAAGAAHPISHVLANGARATLFSALGRQP